MNGLWSLSNYIKEQASQSCENYETVKLMKMFMIVFCLHFFLSYECLNHRSFSKTACFCRKNFDFVLFETLLDNESLSAIIKIL